MDLPVEIAVKGIDPFSDSIYLFKNKNHSKSAPMHYHIALPTVDDNIFVLLVMMTSQEEKLTNYYHKLNDKRILQSVISVLKSQLSIISKPSTVIDCNNPIFLTRNELALIVDGSLKSIHQLISVDLKKELIKGIKNSPMVKDYIKNSIYDPEF